MVSSGGAVVATATCCRGRASSSPRRSAAPTGRSLVGRRGKGGRNCTVKTPATAHGGLLDPVSRTGMRGSYPDTAPCFFDLREIFSLRGGRCRALRAGAQNNMPGRRGRPEANCPPRAFCDYRFRCVHGCEGGLGRGGRGFKRARHVPCHNPDEHLRHSVGVNTSDWLIHPCVVRRQGQPRCARRRRAAGHTRV